MRRIRRGEGESDADGGKRARSAWKDASSVTAELESVIDELEREAAALDAREAAVSRALARAELEAEAEDALAARLELELAECRRVMATMRRDRSAHELERALAARSRMGSAAGESSATEAATERARRLAEIDRGFARERARAEAFRKSLEDASS